MKDAIEQCGIPDTTLGGGMDSDWTPTAGGWNGGECRIGNKVVALGVTIGEIINNTDKAFVFLDTEGNIQWLWSTTPDHLSWASMRIVELESKCSFFKQGRTEDLLSGKQDEKTKRKKRSAFLRHELSAKRFIAQGLGACRT